MTDADIEYGKSIYNKNLQNSTYVCYAWPQAERIERLLRLNVTVSDRRQLDACLLGIKDPGRKFVTGLATLVLWLDKLELRYGLAAIGGE